jgi:hypothetical protein
MPSIEVWLKVVEDLEDNEEALVAIGVKCIVIHVEMKGTNHSSVLTPRFSPLKILRVKSRHILLWLAFRDFPRLSTCVS